MTVDNGCSNGKFRLHTSNFRSSEFALSVLLKNQWLVDYDWYITHWSISSISNWCIEWIGNCMNYMKPEPSMTLRISSKFASIIVRRVANHLIVVVLCLYTAIRQFKCHRNPCFESIWRILQCENICNQKWNVSKVS